jgi:hypothetical protein
MGRWKTIHHNGQRLHSIGVLSDGSLYNPNGYPEEIVRAAVAGAEQRRHDRLSAAATKAAATRRRRREKRVYDTARRIIEHGSQGPADHCCICGRGLADSASIERGIGSECWQDVLAHLELVRS